MPAASTIALRTSDGPMPVYEAIPEDSARGGVVVIQEAFGVNDHIEDVTRRLAAEGWHAVAPHLFHRDGAPVVDYGDLEKAMTYTRALTASSMEEDVGACLDHLREAGTPAARVGIVGFCMGGAVTFFAATRWDLGAAVTFYGGGVVESRWSGVPSLVDMAAALRAPWLGLYGDRDHGIPVDQIERLQQAVGSAEVPTETVRYPEAGHGFHCDQRPQNYDQEAARDAWARTLRWFETHVR